MASPTKKPVPDERAMIEQALTPLAKAVWAEAPDSVLKFYGVKSHKDVERLQDFEYVKRLIKEAKESRGKDIEDLVNFTSDADVRRYAFASLIRSDGRPAERSNWVANAKHATLVREVLKSRVWPMLQREKGFPPYKGSAALVRKIVDAYLSGTLINPPPDWSRYRPPTKSRQPSK